MLGMSSRMLLGRELRARTRGVGVGKWRRGEMMLWWIGGGGRGDSSFWVLWEILGCDALGDGSGETREDG